MRQIKIEKTITVRDESGVEAYLLSIKKHPLISALEEVVLAEKIKQGDEKALEKLVNANLRFVVSVAKQYQNQGLKLNDLINEGNVGLVKCAPKFDHTKGFKFISYAVWWIRQSIMQALAENARLVRLPLSKVGLSQKINKATSNFELEFDREPTVEELAEYLQKPLITIQNGMRAAATGNYYSSLNASMPDAEGIEMIETFAADIDSPDKELVQIDSFKKELGRFLKKLSEKQKTVIVLHHGIDTECSPMSFPEIAKKLELNTENIRQTYKKAINKMIFLNKLSNDSLRKFL